MPARWLVDGDDRAGPRRALELLSARHPLPIAVAERLIDADVPGALRDPS
jgi:hypothetical protein